MWIVEIEGSIVGGACYCVAETAPELWQVGVIVAPAYRRRGIGTALYERLLDTLGARGGRRLLTSLYPHQVDGLRFLARRGFREVGSSLCYQLHVAGAADGGASDSDALLAAQGLRCTTLDRFPRHGLAERLLPLWNSTRPDQPQHWPYRPYSAQRLEREMLEPAEVALAHSFAVVSRDNRLVALALSAWLDPGRLGTIYLGVDPAWRGRGLASALKQTLVAHAREQRIAFLAAENDARNTAMRGINTRLGYRHLAELLVYENRLD